MDNCNLCPHNCNANRIEGKFGICKAPYYPKLARAALHYWEEPCISGTRGSGAVFFSHCNLKCIYCQNYDISQEYFGKDISIEKLVDIFLNLQKMGAHNINLVSPTPFIHAIKDAIIKAKEKGLSIPIVYNSNAYENIDAIRQLDGLIDVYLPDLKYYNDKYSIEFSNASHYFDHATSAILEMYRQVGSPIMDDEGIIKKGLIIRHLLLPGLMDDSKKVLDWIAMSLPKSVYISLMAQYTPVYKAKEHKILSHAISKRHYDAIIEYFCKIGLENGYIQDISSAKSDYTPAFDLTGI